MGTVSGWQPTGVRGPGAHAARHVWAWHGAAMPGEPRPDLARQGPPRRGMTWSKVDGWQPSGFEARTSAHGRMRLGMAGPIAARFGWVWPGATCLGSARCGKAWRSVSDWQSPRFETWAFAHGQAMQCPARHVQARRDTVRLGGGAAGFGTVRRGSARQGHHMEHIEECDGKCPRWIGVDSPTCAGYPCQCATTRKNRPKWAESRCWWIVKTTGRTTSRCPCWGSPREGKPGDCCSHHSASPMYAPPPVPVTLDDLDVAPYVDLERPQRVDAAQYHWEDPEEEFEPYKLLWQPAERTCPCVTPFDGRKPARGWHCAGCCSNFSSYAIGEVHRRRWTEPCRDPADIRDIDTGFPLFRQGADGVWSAAYPTAD